MAPTLSGDGTKRSRGNFAAVDATEPSGLGIQRVLVLSSTWLPGVSMTLKKWLVITQKNGWSCTHFVLESEGDSRYLIVMEDQLKASFSGSWKL